MSVTRTYEITTAGPSVELKATGGSSLWEDNAIYRYSYHKEAGLWTDWNNLSVEALNNKKFKDKTLYIEIEITAESEDDIPTLSIATADEEECELPYLTTNDNTTTSEDGEEESCTASIKVTDCGDGDENLYNPYSTGSASTIYNELSSVVSDTFGWDTRYFRTSPVRDSADYIFHEYSLKNVAAANNVKVLIEDNNLPSRSFIIHNPLIDYQETLTVHIVKDEFHNAFGEKTYPREHDYLAFAMKNFNRMYEVIGVYNPDDFLYESSYWIVLLQPYQQRSMVGMDSTDSEVISDRDKAESTGSVTLDDNDGDLTKEIETFTFNKKEQEHMEAAAKDTEKARGDSLLNDKILDSSKKRSDFIADTFSSYVKTSKSIVYHLGRPVFNYYYDMTSKGVGTCAILYHKYSQDPIYRISFFFKPISTITKFIPILSDGELSVWATRKNIAIKNGDYIKSFSTGDTAMTNHWNLISLIIDPDEMSVSRCTVWQQTEGANSSKDKFNQILIESSEPSSFEKYYPMQVDADYGEVVSFGGPFDIANIKIASDPVAPEKEFAAGTAQISRDMQTLIVSDLAIPRITSESIEPLVKHPDNHAVKPTPQYTLTLSIDPDSSGTVTGSGTYDKGTTVEISATSDTGYNFKEWSDGDTNATRSIVINDDITLTATFEEEESVNVIDGELPGLFSVSDEDVVKFSKGNLQYNAVSNDWKLADHQYDYIGSDNDNISETYDGYIDLFGWGTSGWDSGATAYEPFSSDPISDDYCPGGDVRSDLVDDYSKADWGYNKISNGGNVLNRWITLTKDEFEYLYDGRENAANLRTRAVIDGINGYIFFPDNWEPLEDVDVVLDTAQFDNNKFTKVIWNLLELSGAVFLPAGGDRDEVTTGEINNYGDYWTTTHYDDKYSYCFTFNKGREYVYQAFRACGHSVRLARIIHQITSMTVTAPERIITRGKYLVYAKLDPENANDYSITWNVADPSGNLPDGVTVDAGGSELSIYINVDSSINTTLTITATDEMTGVSSSDTTEIDTIGNPLCFTATADSSTVTLNNVSTKSNVFQTSTDKINWNDYTLGTAVSLNNGESIYFRGNGYYGSYNKPGFTMTGSIEASGSVMSLIDNTGGLTTLMYDESFAGLFYKCSSLITSPELPATQLYPSCYRNMFGNCTSLISVPELPATLLSNSCYYNMFKGCTALTETPVLPADALANSCYYGMFYECTSIETPPVLPSMNLADSCYGFMFYNCASLATAPELPATALKYRCYFAMFMNCSAIATAPKLPAMTMVKECYCEMFYGSGLTGQITLPSTTLAYGCYEMMFYNCKSLVEAPELPATELAVSCYKSMFEGCANLKSAPELHAMTLAKSCYFSMFKNCSVLDEAPELPAVTMQDSCYKSMFYNCANLTKAPELPSTELASSCYAHMFNSCIYLKEAPELPATTLATYCYNNMFYNCKMIKTAPKLPAMTLASSCYENMFSSCLGLTIAPELPATTLASSCYKAMFSSCSFLTTPPELPAIKMAASCYQSMFSGCVELANAPELPALALASSCYYSMFYGCKLLKVAPELPATSLVTSCYGYMFNGCSNLNTVTVYAKTWNAKSYSLLWLSQVSSHGTFYNKNGATIPISASGIPTNWEEIK